MLNSDKKWLLVIITFVSRLYVVVACIRIVSSCTWNVNRTCLILSSLMWIHIITLVRRKKQKKNRSQREYFPTKFDTLRWKTSSCIVFWRVKNPPLYPLFIYTFHFDKVRKSRDGYKSSTKCHGNNWKQMIAEVI